MAEPTEAWEEELNAESEKLYPNAIVDPSIAEFCDSKDVSQWKSNASFQLERFGYFVVDIDTSFSFETCRGKIVLNRTVSLKEEEFKKTVSADEQAALNARRAEQRRQMEAKEARMKINPKDLFREAPEYKGKYSQYDSDGVPTHDASGVELTKSAIKTLKKEQAKHSKVWGKK